MTHLKDERIQKQYIYCLLSIYLFEERKIRTKPFVYCKICMYIQYHNYYYTINTIMNTVVYFIEPLYLHNKHNHIKIPMDFIYLLLCIERSN